jgi:uncharacterized OsmC-like protein
MLASNLLTLIILISRYIMLIKGAQKIYRVIGTGIRSNCFIQSYLNRELITSTISTPKTSSITPIELLLSSLIGCEQATSSFVAQQMNLILDRVEFDVYGERDATLPITLPLQIDLPPTRLHRIYGTATVFTSSSQKEIDALQEEVHKRCPVANMVILSGCILDIKWLKAT